MNRFCTTILLQYLRAIQRGKCLSCESVFINNNIKTKQHVSKILQKLVLCAGPKERFCEAYLSSQTKTCFMRRSKRTFLRSLSIIANKNLFYAQVQKNVFVKPIYHRKQNLFYAQVQKNVFAKPIYHRKQKPVLCAGPKERFCEAYLSSQTQI